MRSVLEIITASSDYLAARGIESPRLNAEHLIGHALGLPRMQLYMQFERPLMERELEAIRTLLRRRARREPLQYILGETEFFGLTLKVDPRALIPRPETEYLVSLLTERLSAPNAAPPPRRILDLGTGSGAIALALAKHWPDAQVVALDASADALELARENAAQSGLADRVTFAESDWFSAFEKPDFAAAQPKENAPPDSLTQGGPCASREERDARSPSRASVSGGGTSPASVIGGEALPFDLIVSNPPYLTVAEVADSLAEVRDYEPQLALTPGDDTGLEAIRKIVREAPRYLTAPNEDGAGGTAENPAAAAARVSGGWLAMETGTAQHAALAQLLPAAGFTHYEFANDLTGRPRYAFASAGNPRPD